MERVEEIEVIITPRRMKLLRENWSQRVSLDWMERTCACPPGCECCDDPERSNLFWAHRRRVILILSEG